MQNNEYVVEMRGIDKIYPNGIAANQGVDFLVDREEHTSELQSRI